MSNLSVFCPICGANDVTLLSKKLRRGDGIVYFCSDCDLGFLENRDFDAIDYYKSDYRKSVSHKAEPSPTNSEEIFATYVNKQHDRIDQVLPYINRETRFLELGASAGQFIHHVLDKCASISAVELDKDCKPALEKIPGVRVSGEPLSSSEFYGSVFDVICAFQVLEHIPEPVSFLKDMYASLAPGGVAFVEVPNLYDPLLSVWNIEEYKDFYYHEDHLFYFTDRALSLCAMKAGFDETKISFNYTQDYNLLNQLHWITARQPQATCEIGLSPINVALSGSDISIWLSQKLIELDEEYRQKLSTSRVTSNIMMKLAK